MIAAQEDQVAMRQALRAVSRAAGDAECARDTEAVRKAIDRVRDACMTARELAQAIEDNTRNAAQRELEVSLEQRVGMEMETL